MPGTEFPINGNVEGGKNKMAVTNFEKPMGTEIQSLSEQFATYGNFDCIDTSNAFTLTSGSISSDEAKTAIDTLYTNLSIGFHVRRADFYVSGGYTLLVCKYSNNYGCVKCIGDNGEYNWTKNGANEWNCKQVTLVSV